MYVNCRGILLLLEGQSTFRPYSCPTLWLSDIPVVPHFKFMFSTIYFKWCFKYRCMGDTKKAGECSGVETSACSILF